MSRNYRIFLFGSAHIEQDGEPITGFESRKALALLAYLVVARQPVSRSRLADLLWQDKMERQGRRNLRRVLHNVSSLLPDCFQADRQTIQFQASPNCWVDLYEFTEGASDGSIEQLTETVTLYQGEFIAGFYLDGCPDFESWLIRQRESWRGQQLSVLEKLIAHHTTQEQDDHVHVRALLEQILAIEPWREEAHRQLMRLLSTSGQRGAALAQYEICRRILAEELDVEPGPETAALYEQIRDGMVKRGVRVEPASPPPARPRHNLPAQLTPLVGRQRELDDLARFLDEPAQRLITIVGPGGSGKTHLALSAARSRLGCYSHGVYFVPLAPLSEPQSIIPAIAEAVGYPLQANGRSPDQQLQDFLKDKQVLLILDNFEHLLEASGTVAALLETAAKLKVLATARTRLSVQGEQLYPLSGLSYPATQNGRAQIREIESGRYEAITLFEQSARRMQPTFVLSDDNLAAVARICRLVWGMPLAILLSAAWMEMLTPTEIATEIGQSFEFLQADWRNLPRRQQSLRVVFEHSWNLLSEAEQRIFAELSIFRGGFTAEAARAVTGASLAELMGLKGKFLVHRTPGGRYEIHELLRQFAAQKLAYGSVDEKAVRDRHSGYYTAFLSQRESDLKGSRQKGALLEIDRERENIRAAWNWAVESHDVAQLDQAKNSLGHFYEWRGRYQETEAAFRVAVEALRVGCSAGEMRLLAKLLLWQAIFNRLLGNTTLADKLVRQSLRQLDEPSLAEEDTRAERAAALLELGWQTKNLNLAEARGYFEKSLTLFRSLNDAWGTAQVSYALGSRLSDQAGRQAQGRALLEESLSIYRQLGSQRGIAGVLESLGFMAMLQGAFEEGEPLLHQALTIRREMTDRAALVRGLVLLTCGLIFSGRFTEACNLVEEGIAVSGELGHKDLLASSQSTLGFAQVALADYEAARHHAGLGFQLARETGDAGGISYSLWALGKAALGESAYDEAEQSLQESVELHRKVGERSRLGDVIVNLGYALFALNRIAQARQCLYEVLQIIAENQFFHTKLSAVILAALIALSEAKPERTIELYALATQYPFVENSRWFKDVAGRHVTAAAVELPPEVDRAAQARGRARDLDTTIAALQAEFGCLD